MTKRMSGNRRERDYPVLESEEAIAVSNKKNAELMAKAFV